MALGPDAAMTWVHEGVCLPTMVTIDALEQAKNFEVRDDDIWLCTYPKSGTHWLIQIIQLLRFNGDFDKVLATGLKVCPIFEVVSMKPDGSQENEFEHYNQLPSPRLIVSHLPMKFLPTQLFEKKAKVIYLTRNPKDIAVSLYHFTKPIFDQMNMKLEWEPFLDTILLSDRAPYGPWATHVIPYWNRRNEDNVLFLKYEDIQKDTMKYIRDVAVFIGFSTSETVLQKTLENSNAGKTKIVADNRAAQAEHTRKLGIGSFVRKGIVGDWMTQFTVAQSRAVDEVIKNHLKGTTLEIEYE